jgi:hypothetical protein
VPAMIDPRQLSQRPWIESLERPQKARVARFWLQPQESALDGPDVPQLERTYTNHRPVAKRDLFRFPSRDAESTDTVTRGYAAARVASRCCGPVLSDETSCMAGPTQNQRQASLAGTRRGLASVAGRGRHAL